MVIKPPLYMNNKFFTKKINIMTSRIFISIVLSWFVFTLGNAQWSSNNGVTHTSDVVGIGTDTPAGNARLTIDNGTDAALSFYNGGYLVLGDVNSTNIVLDNNEIMARNNGGISNLGLQADGGSLTVHASSSIPDEEKFHINNWGDVGIGTLQIPVGYKLAVNGSIIAEELKVQLSQDWPDYVFQSDYQLLSLEEVEAHIRSNGHLPNIPSATEVKENGITVGDMQRRMMEKIEELTLHLIEQDKQIKAFQKQNEVLMDQVSSLEKK